MKWWLKDVFVGFAIGEVYGVLLTGLLCGMGECSASTTLDFILMLLAAGILGVMSMGLVVVVNKALFLDMMDSLFQKVLAGIITGLVFFIYFLINGIG